ncbi:MAG: VWA domain-containing protein [Pirellula sp.]|jgi:Flp pilus assembly protein TadG|nr:VWA domain-containing protein [Pirellula sp.]
MRNKISALVIKPDSTKRLQRLRRGAVVPLFAIMLPVLIILSAFAINFAYFELSRTQMFISSDAASRAAGREFMITNDRELAKAKGREAANRNPIAGKPLQLADSDFVFGSATRNSLENRYNFQAGGSRPNAVEVTARRTSDSLDGPLPMLIPSPFTGIVQSHQTSRANQIEVDISLVIDRSGSMAYADNEPAVFPPLPAAAPPNWFFDGPAPTPSRWRDAVRAVDMFIAELESSPMQELVSLTTYSTDAELDVPLTDQYQQIRNALDGYTQFFTSGKTNIGGGIDGGRNGLSSPAARPFAAKVMIVLTDGIDTMGSNPIQAAKDANNDEIMIFSITFAQEADQNTMRQVASEGQGKHYHAASGTSLAAIFRDIARQLPILLSK